MTRVQINRWAAIAPIVMSGVALALVVVVLATGWERNLADEGAAAHLFQLLIVAEIPLMGLFLWTSDRAKSGSAAGLLLAQLAAIGIALAPVALFHL
jgi:hypothetical protein